MESMKDFEQELERSFRKISVGDIITGTVIGVTEDEVTLDLNYYTQGIIKTENLSEDPSFSIFDIQEGDVMEATVVRLDDGHGSMELSKKEANEVLAWDKLKTLMEEKTVVTVKIQEAVKAGVITYLEGIRAFIPASQLASDYVEDTTDFVGKSIDVQVITVDREADKLVLSGKAVSRAKEEEDRNHRISMIAPGTVLEGVVETIKPYGAFVSLGNGLSGLLHISQISQKRISSPHAVLKEGQHVKVKVLNTKDNRISLSMKVLEEEVEAEEAIITPELEQYISKESTGTSLGDLLAGLKL